ncbi:HNH endonuclease [Streptomyces sp. NPDC002346]
MSRKTMLNSQRRRVRKEQLARRHGQHCAYCRRPFADLREATLDHVAPQSLWRTWTVTALVLACTTCNNRKADRLPLSLALLLVFTHGGEQVADPGGQPTGHLGVRPGQSDSSTGRSGVHVDSKSPDPTALDWRLLARLAHANQSAYAAVRRPVSIGTGSTPDLRDGTRHALRHAPVTRSIGRPDCLRAHRLLRTCSRPTGMAVPA